MYSNINFPGVVSKDCTVIGVKSLVQLVTKCAILISDKKDVNGNSTDEQVGLSMKCV